MNIVICVNHAPPHVGGCEKIVQIISETLVKKYNCSVTILSHFFSGRTNLNGVKIQSCFQNSQDFLRQLRTLEPDHIFVYSDSFFHWPTILQFAEFIPGTKSIAPVGLYKTIERDKLKNLFIQKQKLFTVITHSEFYSDYLFLTKNNIPTTVIHNGVDFNEFNECNLDFKKTNLIKTPYMLLCVSNFFMGKGQDHLFYILTKLKRKDFTAVFMATTTNNIVANKLCEDFRFRLRRAPFENKLIIDAPRETVISAFKGCDIFTFPSQKEVSPLVLIETMASGKPWISLPVGNAPSLPGGIVIDAPKDEKGFCKYSPSIHEKFASTINKLLIDESYRQTLGAIGKKEALEQFDMSAIVPHYYDVFCRK